MLPLTFDPLFPHFHYHNRRLSSQVQEDYPGKTMLKPFAILRMPIVAG